MFRHDPNADGSGTFALPVARRLDVGALATPPIAPKSQLLACLSLETREEVDRYATRVTLSPRQILAERNHEIAYAYFIESGTASLSVTAEGAEPVEIMTLGARDFAGFPLILGTLQSPHRCVVQMPGQALRVEPDQLIHLVERNEELRKVLLQCIQTILIQSSQVIACNVRHDLKRRLPRWLLETSEKLCSEELPVTQTAAAYALGVRRAGVTNEIARLERDGLIVHQRGKVTIVNRQGLERASCNCHRVVELTRERCFSRSSQTSVKYDCSTVR